MLVLANGALICNMPLGDVLEEHIRSGADITCVCAPGGDGKTTSYLMDEDGTITDVVSRGEVRGGCDALEVYIISKKLLLELIAECDGHNEYSFHRAVLQGMKNRLKLHAYVFRGYAARIMSVDNYYKRSMELLRAEVRADLFLPERPIRTKDAAMPPPIMAQAARASIRWYPTAALLRVKWRTALFSAVSVWKKAQKSVAAS